MTWRLLAPATSAATVSSPRFSGWRPASGVRAMSIAGPSHQLKALAARLGADRLAVGSSEAAVERGRERLREGNEVVPSARMPLGPSCGTRVGTPKPATAPKSPSAIATFWSNVSA